MENNNENRKYNRAYTDGNVAYKDAFVRELEQSPDGRHLKEVEGNRRREKFVRFNFAYGVFLVIATVILGYALVNYLKLQADITLLNDNIAAYETRLNNLTLENDDEYSKMVTSVDFDEIRKIAIEELGMTYATEEQIVSYKRTTSDYVRQVNDLTR